MKIIMNADDFGLSHEANLGIKQAMQENLCSQTSIVTNSNYYDEAVEIAFKYGFENKVSLHINLFEGTPLSGAIKKLKHYAFYDSFYYKPSMIDNFFQLHKDAIGEELEKQIEKYLNSGFSLKNIDSHHCSFYDWPVLISLVPLLKKYGFRTIRCIGTSFFNGSQYRNLYGKRWFNIVDNSGVRHLNYSSSVSTYKKNKINKSNKLIGQKAIEVYIHPVLIGKYLIDNYTGGNHIKESFADAGLQDEYFISIDELDFQGGNKDE